METVQLMATDPNVPPALNSPKYWDHRFMSDWDEKGGPSQTRFFSALSLSLMPHWLKSELKSSRMKLLDFGCAEGAGLPQLAEAFPGLTLAGADISPVAIAKARERHPQFEFFVLQSQDALPVVDVVFSSNTLEHIADWRATLNSLAQITGRHLVVVAPFREKAPLFEEHCASFDFDSLPAELGNGLRLVHVSACETTWLPGSMWVGEQFLAVWSREAGSGSDAVDHAEADILDLRHVATAAVPAALNVAKRAYARLAETRAALRSTRQDLDQAKAQLEYRMTLAANEALTARVALENEAHTKRVELENEAHTKRVELENALYMAKAEADAALTKRTDLERTLHQIREAIGDEAALVAPDDTLATRVQKLRQELEGLSRSLVAGSAAFAEEFNARLAAKERVVQASVDTLRQNYTRITSMRSFRLMMRGLSKYARFRGTTITMPPSPERVAVTFDRIDSQSLLRALWKRPLGMEVRSKATRQPSPRVGSPPQTARPPDAEVVLLQIGALDRGGVEQVVYDLATGMRAKGEHVVIFAVDRGGEIANRLSDQGFAVEIFGGWNPEAYRRAVAALKIKTAYLHGTLDGADILAEQGIRVVEVIHNYYHWLQDDVAAYQRKAAHVSQFVAVSSSVADFHASVFGIARDRIEVINNALNPDGLIRPERRLLEWSRRDWRNRFVFVNVAQFVPPKAHAALIAAFAKVREVHPQAHLRLIGGPADADTADRATELIKRLGVADAVEMPGFLDRRALSAALSSAHVFVQPSVFEGYSVAMTEAAYFALPVILTNIGGASDLVRGNDCGILVPPPLPTLQGVSAVRINDTGLSPEAPHVQALIAAMSEMIVNYEAWTPRGYTGQRRVAEFGVPNQIERYRRIETGSHGR